MKRVILSRDAIAKSCAPIRTDTTTTNRNPTSKEDFGWWFVVEVVAFPALMSCGVLNQDTVWRLFSVSIDVWWWSNSADCSGRALRWSQANNCKESSVRQTFTTASCIRTENCISSPNPRLEVEIWEQSQTGGNKRSLLYRFTFWVLTVGLDDLAWLRIFLHPFLSLLSLIPLPAAAQYERRWHFGISIGTSSALPKPRQSKQSSAESQSFAKTWKMGWNERKTAEMPLKPYLQKKNCRNAALAFFFFCDNLCTNQRARLVVDGCPLILFLFVWHFCLIFILISHFHLMSRHSIQYYVFLLIFRWFLLVTPKTRTHF